MGFIDKWDHFWRKRCLVGRDDSIPCWTVQLPFLKTWTHLLTFASTLVHAGINILIYPGTLSHTKSQTLQSTGQGGGVAALQLINQSKTDTV